MENSLKTLRKAAGYKTAKAFAEAIGMPATTYSKYELSAEDGEVSMPLKSAWTIADALGCTIDALVGRGDVPEAGMSGDIQRRYGMLSDDGKELVDGFLAMVEGREKSAAEKRRAELARVYMNEARRAELIFLQVKAEKSELVGDFETIGSELEMRVEFERYTRIRLALEETKRVDDFCEYMAKTRDEGFDVESYRERLKQESDARVEEVMEGIMAAYDSTHPVNENVFYSVVKL